MSGLILTEADVARFNAHKKPGKNGCIIWTGGLKGARREESGYPIFRIYQPRSQDVRYSNGRGKQTCTSFNARKISYEIFHGSIPDKSEIVSKCGNQVCVNPEHLVARVIDYSIEDRFISKTRPGENGCILWTGSFGNGGYGKIHIVENGKDATRRAHRIAYELAFGKIPKGMLVLHKCDNPPCVNPEHLFLGTDKDNNEDMIRKGRANPARGELHHNSKLTEEDVKSIRKKYVRGKYGYQRIARELNVSTEVIRYVVNRKTWRHVD